MEKKTTRQLPIPAKAVSNDTKKDAATSKQRPRNNVRRRESACPSSLEPSRKPQPQKFKTVVDKRPKTRGSYYAARDETPGLNDNQPELGSVLSNNKKQSLQHLLNFSYAPRDSREYHNTNKTSFNAKKQKYNKEHFLQANCRFIVNGSGDYKKYMSDPDALVDWNLIEQVNVQVSEFASCPICLYPPMAAKITRCGHIYCWSCILHYLALSDKTSRKCPICYTSIYKSDLKSVIAVPHTTFNINEQITLKLMKRQKGCMTVYPVDADMKEEGTLFNMCESGVDDVYSKLLLANNDNIMVIIDRESSELQMQMIEDGDCPEKCFIEEAVDLLNTRRQLIIDLNSNDLTSKVSKICLINDDVNNPGLSQPVTALPAQSGPAVPKIHYFYQAADGQHIYLHAINARMLEHSYGSLEFGPKTITGKILEHQVGSMTTDVRNRLRYLQHLPLTCQFEVIEIQLDEPTISKDTLDFFGEQLASRKKTRKRKEKEEKRREKRIESEENKKLRNYPISDIPLNSVSDFPDFESTIQSERSMSPDLSAITSVQSTPETFNGPSFATMLASKKKSQGAWSALNKSSTSQNLAVSSVRSVIQKSSRSFSGDESEEHNYVPDFNVSFGDALTQALSNCDSAIESGKTAAKVEGKKNKKKNKGKVLFTTNMIYTDK